MRKEYSVERETISIGGLPRSVRTNAELATVTSLPPGTEVIARGFRWGVITSDRLGDQTPYRLRRSTDALRTRVLDLLSPFETTSPARTEFQALGSDALPAMQPGRLREEPYQVGTRGSYFRVHGLRCEAV